VKLVISDAHEGLKGAITRVMGATWQRCRVGLLKKPLSLRFDVDHGIVPRISTLWALLNCEVPGGTIFGDTGG
jgi:Transposase and inactivated derivatives